MTREEKATIIDELSVKLKANSNFYFTDATGMTVAQVNNFRRMCHELSIDYKVYKNTLIIKALDEIDFDHSPLYEKALKGATGILFSKEIANVPAKLIKDFRKKSNLDKPVLKGALIDQDIFLGEEQLEVLSRLKSKNELIGEIISILQSPAQNIISALESGKSTLAGVVKTLSEKE